MENKVTYDKATSVSLNENKMKNEIFQVIKKDQIGSSTVLNEYTVDNRYCMTSYKYEIKLKDVKFLTRLAFFTCLLFPLTGIPSILLTQKMKYHYYESNYQRAIKYKKFARMFSYLNIIFAILTFLVILVCLKIM